MLGLAGNLTEAESIDDIGKNDHVFGIVDGFSKKVLANGSKMDAAGYAVLDGNITLIENRYKDNISVINHETGHLLGLDHTKGTFMNDVIGGSIITNFQKQQIFNRYKYEKNSKYKNTNRDKLNSGSSKNELIRLLYETGANYNSNDLYTN